MTNAKPLPVFLTGASRGIGAATARHFARNGHPLALVARGIDAIEELAREINESGGKAVAIPCDVGDAQSVARAVERAVKELGEIGIVINNAGIIEPIATIVDVDLDAWSHTLDVNLSGPIYVLHHAVPHLPRGGVVINVTSGAAENPSYGRSAYCASKAGLMIATRIFAVEEGEKRGITVIGFSPGLVDTDMNALNRAKRMGSAGNVNLAELRPPTESAQIIDYLCSPAAKDLSGTIVSARDPAFRQRVGV